MQLIIYNVLIIMMMLVCFIFCVKFFINLVFNKKKPIYNFYFIYKSKEIYGESDWQYKGPMTFSAIDSIKAKIKKHLNEFHGDCDWVVIFKNITKIR